jgi:hypothetical protein
MRKIILDEVKKLIQIDCTPLDCTRVFVNPLLEIFDLSEDEEGMDMSLLGFLDDSTFEAQGYAVLPELLGPETVARLNDLIDQHVRPTADSNDVLVADGVISHDREARALLAEADRAISGLFEAASGLTVMHDQMIAKKPNRTLNAPWHQDYVAYAGTSKMTLFIVAGPDGSDGLEIIPGSHLDGPLPHIRKVLPELPATTRAAALKVEVEPGSMLALHPHTIHRGLDNRSPTTSRTYTLMLQDAAESA